MMVAHHLVDAILVGNLNKNDAARAQHFGHGLNDARGLKDVLEDVLADDDIKATQSVLDIRRADIPVFIWNSQPQFRQTLAPNFSPFGVDFNSMSIRSLLGHRDQHSSVARADIENALASKRRDLTDGSNNLSGALDLALGVVAPDFRVVACGIFGGAQALRETGRKVRNVGPAFGYCLNDAVPLVRWALSEEGLVFSERNVIHSRGLQGPSEEILEVRVFRVFRHHGLHRIAKRGERVVPMSKRSGQF